MVDASTGCVKAMFLDRGKVGTCMMRLIRTLGLAVALGLLATASIPAQERGKPAPDAMTGLSVGTQAPGFTLKDQDGTNRSLDELIAKGNVALVFYRSADW